MSQKLQKDIRITIAGASGFVGQGIMASAPEHWRMNALSRAPSRSQSDHVSWRQADLFSLQSATAALKDTDVAIYLVHSMLPSSRLFQGSFADTDLLIADNFARACVKNGVKQIIYLGGLMPTENVSKHLASRQEVEEVFRASGIPCTIIRAGMVAGHGGSSFELLRNLVANLPVMILPRWTQVKTQTIYIDDLVRIIKAAVMNPAFLNLTLNAVNGESLTYEDLIRRTCEVMGKKTILLRVPINSTKFSKLWVSVFGKTDYELTSPLIDSLLCELPQDPPIPLIAPYIQDPHFTGMLDKIMSQGPVKPRRNSVSRANANTVRSIQRLPALPHVCSDEIARAYERFLPKAMWGLIVVTTSPDRKRVDFKLRGLPWPLLILELVGEPDVHRSIFVIVGGLLSRNSGEGWLEFRQLANRRFTLVMINDFVPTLPWYVYRASQAIIHKWVMRSFSKYLSRELAS